MPGLFDPELDPSVIAGDGVPLDVPQPAKRENRWKELAPLLALLPIALSKGGRVGGAALLQGFQQSQRQRQEDARRESIDAENRSYRQGTLARQNALLDMQEQAKRDAAANTEAQRRQQFLTQYGAGFDGIDTPEALQAYVALQQAQGRTLGVDPEELSRMAPTASALSQKRAKKALEQLQKARPDDWMNWSVKVDGQDVKATDLLGVVRDPKAPTSPAADLSKSGMDVQLLDAKRRAAAGDPAAAAEVKLIEETIAKADALRRDPQRQPIVVTVGGSGLTADQLRLAGSLRDDYRAQSKDYFTVRDAFERVQAAAKDPSPAGDVALLYAYMKILDPGSVVRETEFATAAKTGSLPQQIQAAATRVVNGQRLTEQQRADFVGRAKALYDATQGRHSTRVKQFSSMASRSGLPSDLVVVDEEPVGGAPPAPPATVAAPAAPPRKNPFRR